MPILIAKAGDKLEKILTIIIPIIEEIKPIEAKAKGKNIISSLFSTIKAKEEVAAIAIHATIDPQ